MRRKYNFRGRVQGVGFRYTACTEGIRLGLTGWVRNLGDGTVEMEAQGESGTLDQLIKNIEDNIFIRIIETKVMEISEIEENEFLIL